MALKGHRRNGFALIATVMVLFLIGVTVLLSQSGFAIFSRSQSVSKTQATLNKIQDSLNAFVTVNRYLPCPANPALPVGGGAAGYPDGVVSVGFPAVTNCTFKYGIVPWVALNLKSDDVTDEWGRLISYRVFDGQFGFTQANGASATDCDKTNGSTLETPPDAATGLCNADHNTLEASYYRYPTIFLNKGLSGTDFGKPITDAAYVLISHGPSGLGGYTAAGARLPLPDATALDYQHVNTAPAIVPPFLRVEKSTPEISIGATNHFDDIVEYMPIKTLQARTNLLAREWPEPNMPTFNPDTTADMTSPSLDPLRPHFMSTGTSGSGQEFTAQTSSGETEVSFGAAGGSYAGCLWWPLRLTIASGLDRRMLATYVEFAATTSASDRFGGFTMGFLSAYSSAGMPDNNTCGTTTTLRTLATGATGSTVITVADTTGIVPGLNVFGQGIDPAARVASISGQDVTLDLPNINAVAGNVEFADANRIRRDLGWAGGTLASKYTDRFAVEFDTYPDTGLAGPPVVPSASDPPRPHLAIDFGGVEHSVSAVSCASTGSGLPCDSEVTDFPAVSRVVAGVIGSNQITVTDMFGVAGIVPGMSVSGAGIGVGARVTSVVGNIVTLSAPNASDFTNVATFSALSTAGFMQDGLQSFNSMRTEIYPRDCTMPNAAGLLGSTTLTVSDASQIALGMSAYGIGIGQNAQVVAIVGSSVTLSVAHTANIGGPVIFGGWASASTTASGLAGDSTVTVSDPSAVIVGSIAVGVGVAQGATVVSIIGNSVTLSALNVGAVSGSVSFVSQTLPTRTLVKTWAVSNAGCNSSPATCSAMKNVNTKFSVDVASDRQFLNAVACVPSGSSTRAYDALFFGLTTSSRSNVASVGGAVVFRRMIAADSLALPY